MEEATYGRLLERVRERCRLEAQHPEQFSWVEQITARTRGTTKTPNGLPFPPATEAQLAATETRLQFPLPPLLRRLYAEVGNGGFGPAYGIIGAVGGAPHLDDFYVDIADAYRRFSARWLVNLSDIPDASIPGRHFTLADDGWPKYLLPLCYWGCTTEHGIHAETGAIYLIRDYVAYALWAPSLAAWLEQWLDGTLQQE